MDSPTARKEPKLAVLSANRLQIPTRKDRAHFSELVLNRLEAARADYDKPETINPEHVYEGDDEVEREVEATIPMFNNDGEGIQPAPKLRLSDLQVYTAPKNMNNAELARNWPYDFDSNGNIRSLKNRKPKDPAPVVWAHGIPWIVVIGNHDSVKDHKLPSANLLKCHYILTEILHASGMAEAFDHDFDEWEAVKESVHSLREDGKKRILAVS